MVLLSLFQWELVYWYKVVLPELIGQWTAVILKVQEKSEIVLKFDFCFIVWREFDQ